jgi:pimeloyl-ACP methyl ester carboxylesterase
MNSQVEFLRLITARNTVAKRLVFHIGGYDPVMPASGAQRRFVRELARFQATWSLKAFVDGLRDSADQTEWKVTTTGPNWRVETGYHFVRWDDVIETFKRRTIWSRIPRGILAFLDFVIAGALRGYLRTNWHYAGFFLYPFVALGALVVAALLAGVYAFKMGGSASVAFAVGLLALGGVMAGPWRWLHLGDLFDDWIFSYEYIRKGNSSIERKLDKLAAEIVGEAKNSGADEVLVIGHSLGAVIAIDLLDRALKLDGSIGASGSPVTLITIGSSILKIGLHRAATRFRTSVERVARAANIFWADYQARVDVLNFYDTKPMAEMALPREYEPTVKLVEFSRMLERRMYRRIRLRFYRMHCQFISGNDKRALYDYFMLVCGPVSAKSQTLAEDGAVSMIGQDGALMGMPPSTGGRLSEPARRRANPK